MSIKSKVIAAAATLTLVGGVSVAGALTAGSASAATPSCGSTCVNLYSKQFGSHGHPSYVLDTLRQGERVGQQLILFRTANYDPAEDFTVGIQGTVADFYAANMVGAALALHYGCIPAGMKGHNFADCYGQTRQAVNDYALELEYSPYGVASGLCMGVASAAYQGEGVSLQPCGAGANTVWVVDLVDSSQTTLRGGYVPLINGTSNNFSHPFVLTYPASAFPTDMPRPQLTVTNLTGAAAGLGGPEIGTVQSNQLWSANFGVLS